MENAKQIEFKSFVVRDNVFQRITLFYIGYDMRIFENEYEKLLGTDELPSIDLYKDFYHSVTCMGRTIFTNNICIVLLKDMELPYVVHEIFHAVEYHFEKIGLKHGEDSSEAWAYYIQFLMEQFVTHSTRRDNVDYETTATPTITAISVNDKDEVTFKVREMPIGGNNFDNILNSGVTS